MDNQVRRAVLFDLDGTLVDSAPDLHAAVNTLLERKGLAPASYLEIRSMISGGAQAILSTAFAKAPQVTINQQLIDEYLEIYCNCGFKLSKLFPHIYTTLAKLRQLRVTWGVVTNKKTYLANKLLASLELPGAPDCMVGGDSTPNPKPSPEPLLYACTMLDISPQNCLYIGDGERDILAGKHAGMETMAVEFGYVPTNCNIQDWQPNYIAQHSKDIISGIESWLQAK